MNPCPQILSACRNCGSGLRGPRKPASKVIRALAVGLGTVVGAGLGATPATATPTFTAIYAPEGARGLVVRGVSDNGQVVVGELTNGQGRAVGYRWRAGQPLELFGTYGSPQESFLVGVSGDGNYAVGTKMIGPGTRVAAFRMQDLSQPEQLPQFGGYVDSQAKATNADGSVVVGYGRSGTGIAPEQAFRWTAQGGMQALGFLRPEPGIQSRANAVSADGNTIAGYLVALSNSGLSEAFVWKPTTGMQMLRSPEGSFSEAGIDVGGISNNGRFIVGSHTLDRRLVRGVLWDDGNPMSLGLYAEAYSVRTKDVTSDGRIVVGDASTEILRTGVVWTSGRGFEALSDFLSRNGVVLPTGSRITTCDSVTDDGMTFGGTMRHDGRIFGFIATIPNVGTSFALVLGLAFTRRSRQS